jgi:glutamate formiminotransferase/formiminotetrahydrofolate cyclodeaminase
MNLTNIKITPVHIAFDEVCKKANERGIRVTGSEIVGLIPLKAMLDAGKYFLEKQQRSTGVSEKELIKIAVKSMGLDELSDFNPAERIIEYILEEKSSSRLINMTLNDFADETASESPAPGGGSISAYVGALGVSLGTMVANLSSHKKGWDAQWKYFSDWALKGQELKKEMLRLVDEDTLAFNKIMMAFGLPKGTDDEKKIRTEAIQEATKYAIITPFNVMELCYKSMELLKEMVENGNPNSVTDAAVGALCARTGVIGAFMNVKINAVGLNDKEFVKKIIADGQQIQDNAVKLEQEIIAMTNTKIALN